MAKFIKNAHSAKQLFNFVNFNLYFKPFQFNFFN